MHTATLHCYRGQYLSTLDQVDWVDLLLLALMLLAALRGARLGALMQLLTFGAFWIGMAIGAVIAEPFLRSISSARLKSDALLIVMFGFALLFSMGGRFVGERSDAKLRRFKIWYLDSVLGFIIAAASVLLSAWLIAGVLTSPNSRFTSLDSSIAKSHLLNELDSALPSVPSFLAHIQGFLSNKGFPTVFSTLPSHPLGVVELPSLKQSYYLATPALSSTVKIEGSACGVQVEGTGFVVGPGLVATNAHVIAGEPVTEVQIGSSFYKAVAVYFNPRLDLAILRTNAPLGPTLDLNLHYVNRGTQSAIVGYPENGPLTVTPAGIAGNLMATGPDIYNSGSTTRDIYQLDATVKPGNSGSPLIESNGTVVGIVFSRSINDPNIGYALASPDLVPIVDRALISTHRVSTQSCTND